MTITLLGRFTFDAALSHRDGGQGEIFKGYDTDLDRHVAVKRIYLADALSKSSFKKEVEALARLKHSNIIKIIDNTIIDDFGFLILPWYEQNLLEYLEDQIQWSFQWALDRIIRPLVDALAYMHELNQSHRDITAKNIMMELKRPLFIDFASSTLSTHRDLDQTAGPTFSRGYTPDEFGTVFQKDVYSFGVLALEAITKSRLQSRVQVMSELNKLNTRRAREILTKCLEENPEDRYSDAMQLKLAWDAIFLDQVELQQERSTLGQIILTNNAREALKTWNKGKTTLENSLTTHLNSSLLHWYPVGDEEGRDTFDKFWLIADGVRLLLGASDEKNGWKAITAINSDSEDLEKYRRKGKEITYYKMPWEVTKFFESSRLSRSGFEFITERYVEWLETGKPNSAADLERQDARNYMSKLLRVMEAREGIARGSKDPLYFENAKSMGNRITMQLRDVPEYPLEGTFWRLAAKGNLIGEIDYQSGLDVNLILRYQYSGKVPTSGKLLPDLEAGSINSYKRQKDAIDSIISGSARGSKIGDFLANPQDVPQNHLNYPENWFIPRLDEPKKQAVRQSLGSSSLTLVEGPPGTGKTTYISELIAQTLAKDSSSRILLVSQTHVALDNALERLSELNIDGVVRLGNPSSERISDLSRKLLIDTKMVDWVASLESKSNEYAARYAQRQGYSLQEARQMLALSKAIQAFKEMTVLRESVRENIDIDFESNATEDFSSTMSQVIEINEAIDDEKRESLAQGLLEKYVDEIGNNELKVLYEAGSLQLIHLEESLNSVMAGRAVDDVFTGIIQAQSEWLNRVGSSDQLSQIFLKTCRVLAGTCIGFLGHPSVRSLDFDLCILDEASRATITESLVPMSRSAKWVIVGDSKQLGAFEGDVGSKPEVLEEYDISKEDIFETFFTRFESLLSNENKSFLSIQYRMNNKIGELISENFYEGKIESQGPENLIGLEEIGFSPVTWLDTSEFPTSLREESRPLATESISNRSECIVIVKSIEKISTAIHEKHLEFARKPLILIVTPYLHQIEAIKLELGELRFSDRYELEIQTIDAVQGREADLVLYSPVRSNSRGAIGFLNQENFSRTNVALSRGRHMTAIIGDRSFWQEVNSPLSHVLRHIENGGGRIEVIEYAQ